MFLATEKFYPSWDKRTFNAIEQHLQSNNGTNIYSNTRTEHWIPSNRHLDKNGSFIIGSQFTESATNSNGIHNDENDGLVFGCPQQYYDSKQYAWV